MSREPFKFWRAQTISLERLKLHDHILKTVGYVKSQYIIDKSPLKAAWLGAPNGIYGMAIARIIEFCTQIDNIKS